VYPVVDQPHQSCTQAFKFLFTSLTLAIDINGENDVEISPVHSFKHQRGQKAPMHGHIASLLGMRVVTPQAIAYVGVQVRLNDTSHIPLLIISATLCSLQCIIME
jgi:hypothetical protein